MGEIETKVESENKNNVLQNHKSAIHKELTIEEKCDICETTFDDKIKYYRHRRVHIERKTYCNICRKYVFDFSHHEKRVHKERIKLTCELCSKSFSNEAGLDRHMKTTHDSPGKKKYECNVCSRHFATKTKRDR